MNKLLNIIKILLIITMIIIYKIVWDRFEYVERGPFLFAIFIGIFVLLLIKDIIKKNKIIYDKKFNILTIIALSIICIILLRSLIDTHFLCNNLSLKNIIDSYQTAQYGYASGYDDLWEWFGYINQNMKYFISLIILLLIYRKINIEKKTNK